MAHSVHCSIKKTLKPDLISKPLVLVVVPFFPLLSFLRNRYSSYDGDGDGGDSDEDYDYKW